MNRSGTAHPLALGAAFLVIAVATLCWLAWFKSYPRGTGFDDLSGVAVPFALIGLTALWLIVRALLHGRVQWRTITVVVVAFAFALAPVIIYCGPVACFAPGPSKFMGWFIVIGVAVAALAHHWALEAASRKPRAEG